MAGPVTGSPGTGGYYSTGKPGSPAPKKNLLGSGNRTNGKANANNDKRPPSLRDKVVVSQGSRSNAANAARAAAAKKNARKIPAPRNANKTVVPDLAGSLPTGITDPPAGNIEDQALQGNYDPNSVMQTDNAQIAGLAGKIQLPNAMSYANSMANLQYGNKIQQIAGRIKGLTAALPGSLQALDKAFANLDTQRAITPPVTSGVGVANLFGGNTGAAAIAANQAQTAQATADNQAGIASDHTQANATRLADWKSRLQFLEQQQVGQGRVDLAGAIGERDAAKKGYYDQGLKMRGDMVSQAIGNQGALNNQRIASALAGGQLESQGLTNEAKALQNATTGIQNKYLPTQLQIQVASGKQGLINSVTQNNINVATAKAQLKALNEQQAGSGGVDSMAKAKAAGGQAALYGMILPTGSVVQDATTGSYKFNGDPNRYFSLGVKNIMSNLPKSDRKKVRDFVSNQIQLALNTSGNPWKYQNGKFVKAPKATK
jgi:hypothetical protein